MTDGAPAPADLAGDVPLSGSPARRPRIQRSVPLVALAWVVSAVPLAVQLRHLKYAVDTGPRVAAVMFVGLLVVLVVPRLPVMVLSAVGSVLVAHRLDPMLHLGTLGTIVVLPASWCAALGAFQPPAWRPLRPLLVGAVLPLVLADVQLVVFSSLKVPLVLVALALGSMANTLVHAGLVAPKLVGADHPGRIMRLVRANQRLLDRIGRPFGVIAGVVGMLPGAVILTVAWLAQRLVRFDAIAPPTLASTRWVGRGELDADAASPFVSMQVLDPRGPGRVAHRWLAGSLAVAIISAVGGVGYLVQRDGPTPKARLGALPCLDVPTNDVDPAMDEDAGWPLISCLTTQFTQFPHFDAVTTYAFDDYHSKYVNEASGIRPGWTPPPCACRRIRVWWFGGSAAWGWYQRDDHSLPSQVAKAAWSHGIALDIVNYAMPGWVAGQGVRRFGSLLSTEEAPPDVAVFYDGGNDLVRQLVRNDNGRGDDTSGTSAAEEVIGQLLAKGPFGWSIGDGDAPAGPSGRRLPPEGVASAAMQRYGRDVTMGTDLAATVGATPLFVFQPLLGFAPRRLGNPNALSVEDEATYRRMRPVIVRRLPEGVIDLTGVLDDARRPVFKDLFHTNEMAATMIADALFQRIRPRLEAVLAPAPDVPANHGA